MDVNAKVCGSVNVRHKAHVQAFAGVRVSDISTGTYIHCYGNADHMLRLNGPISALQCAFTTSIAFMGDGAEDSQV